MNADTPTALCPGPRSQKSALRFSEYLSKYRNTICGRHPIAVLLNVSFEISESTFKFKFQLCDIDVCTQKRVCADTAVD